MHKTLSDPQSTEPSEPGNSANTDTLALPLQPSREPPTPLSAVVKLFATGLTGGVLSLVSLSGLAATQHTCGATRGLQIDRQRQQRCLELGVTPEELAEIEAREGRAARGAVATASDRSADATASLDETSSP